MEDFRALVRGKVASKETRRVESAFARYTATGHLVCTLCSLTIKTESLWPAHISSKKHREVVAFSPAHVSSLVQFSSKKHREVVAFSPARVSSLIQFLYPSFPTGNSNTTSSPPCPSP